MYLHLLCLSILSAMAEYDFKYGFRYGSNPDWVKNSLLFIWLNKGFCVKTSTEHTTISNFSLFFSLV